MTEDEYVLSVLSRYQLPTGPNSLAYLAAQKLFPAIEEWADNFLLAVNLSGSYAKGTSVKGSTNVDLFISLAPETPGTLKDIYESLYSHLKNKYLLPRRQNVSIRVIHLAIHIDLVPARKQPGNTDEHSLFRSKAQTWTQTNVSRHIDLVRESGFLNEIRAIKIWRNLHGIDFPSFYLELTALDALYGKKKDHPARNVRAVLEYLSDYFIDARVVDPANPNNIVSDDLTPAEKMAVARAAKCSLEKESWEEIIW